MASSPTNRPPTQVRRRPGNRVVRRSILPSETVQLKKPRARRPARNPAVVLVLGFAAMILIGTILLVLPLSSETGEPTNIIDALFTATSAVCVTGLVVVDTASYWSTFGEAVIILLIQAGGFGFMTSSTLLLMLVGRRTTLHDRLVLGQALGSGAPGELLTLVRRIAMATIAIELAGALFLMIGFLSHGQALGQAVWWGGFHAISAFNNAGFDLVGDFQSLIPYRRNVVVLGVVSLLILLGSISFQVIADMFVGRRWRRLSIDSKLVLSTTTILLLVGMVLVLAFESDNPQTIGELNWPYRVFNAVFMSIAPRTAGFAQFNTDQLSDPTLFMLMPLMFIGGSSGSTAGGIKLQTFALLFFAILAAMRGREHAVAFGREVSHVQVYRALTVALLGIALVISVAMILTVTELMPFIDILFESVSAFATVGLSTGVTPDLSIPGRLVIILLMFAGRLGPLTLALALAARVRRERVRYAQESVRIG